MRLSFAYFALALPLLAASQANYLISSEQTGYYIYHDAVDHSNVNISDYQSTALTVSPTLSGNGAQHVTIFDGASHIGVYIDPNSGPLIVWTNTPYKWVVSPQPGGGYSITDLNNGDAWRARPNKRDIVLEAGALDVWDFQSQN
ncbi:hypothetical protein F5887DRAFT_62104 [Amanita rubescens]|nr:hypothetical protein F5887DRAFT_922822 [Amanita rubescens]KAF8331224.1 hypothetical protein F5887DRAFT_62104 [Amanita rubescens]